LNLINSQSSINRYENNFHDLNSEIEVYEDP